MSTTITREVNVSHQEGETKHTLKGSYSWNFPESISEAQSMLSPIVEEDGTTTDPVYVEFMKGLYNTVDNIARNRLKGMESSLSEDERKQQLQSFMDSWTYGQRPPRKARKALDPQEAIIRKFEAGTKEEQEAMLAALAERLGVSIAPLADNTDQPASEEAPRRRRA